MYQSSTTTVETTLSCQPTTMDTTTLKTTTTTLTSASSKVTKDSTSVLNITTISNSPSITKNNLQTTLDIFVSSSADDFMLTTNNYNNDTELGKISKNIIRIRQLGIIFGLFLLFIICVGIGCLCLTKCKRQSRRIRRMVSSRHQLQTQSRNPIFTGSIEIRNIHNRRLEELQKEDQKLKNQRSKQQKNKKIDKNLVLEVNELSEQEVSQECQGRPEIGPPVLVSTSYINENYRPNNLYEKERAE